VAAWVECFIIENKIKGIDSAQKALPLLPVDRKKKDKTGNTILPMQNRRLELNEKKMNAVSKKQRVISGTTCKNYLVKKRLF
jgi:hypothetical protein